MTNSHTTSFKSSWSSCQATCNNKESTNQHCGSTNFKEFTKEKAEIEADCFKDLQKFILIPEYWANKVIATWFSLPVTKKYSRSV
jgi:hypothetical protein